MTGSCSFFFQQSSYCLSVTSRLQDQTFVGLQAMFQARTQLAAGSDRRRKVDVVVLLMELEAIIRRGGIYVA